MCFFVYIYLFNGVSVVFFQTERFFTTRRTRPLPRRGRDAAGVAAAARKHRPISSRTIIRTAVVAPGQVNLLRYCRCTSRGTRAYRVSRSRMTHTAHFAGEGGVGSVIQILFRLLTVIFHSICTTVYSDRLSYCLF